MIDVECGRLMGRLPGVSARNRNGLLSGAIYRLWKSNVPGATRNRASDRDRATWRTRKRVNDLLILNYSKIIGLTTIYVGVITVLLSFLTREIVNLAFINVFDALAGRISYLYQQINIFFRIQIINYFFDINCHVLFLEKRSLMGTI